MIQNMQIDLPYTSLSLEYCFFLLDSTASQG